MRQITTVFHTKRVEKFKEFATIRDVKLNHRNTLAHAKWPSKTSSLAQMNCARRDADRETQ